MRAQSPRGRPEPAEESGLADREASEVVFWDFACHAEGSGFEFHHPLSGTRWKRRVFALRAAEARPSATLLAIARRPRIRFFLGVGAALFVGGCGSNGSGTVARPQTANLNWHANCGTRADPIPIATRRLVVEKGVWRVGLSFRNRTRLTLFIVRPHVPGGTYFGLEPFRTSSWREVLERAQTGAAKPRTIADRSSQLFRGDSRLDEAGLVSSQDPVDSQSAFPSVLFSDDLWLSDSGRPQSSPGVPLYLGAGHSPQLTARAIHRFAVVGSSALYSTRRRLRCRGSAATRGVRRGRPQGTRPFLAEAFFRLPPVRTQGLADLQQRGHEAPALEPPTSEPSPQGRSNDSPWLGHARS